MATLELRHITKRFKTHTVIDDLSLTVAEGERLVLFGSSGAGKTVLLRLIAGVIDPDQGAILIGGEDVTSLDAEYRGIGMAFQNFALFPHMDAFANIATPLEARGEKESAIRAGVEAVARLLKIDHVLSHRPKALSNGQKQRTALARALAGSPPVLLLDDPLRNVDAKLRFEMRLELPRVLARQGATTIYVTQDYKEAMALGDRIAVMARGKVQQIGTPEEIYLSPANIEIARLFGDPTINLLEVTPKSDPAGVYCEISNVRVALPHVSADVAGKPAVLGLRPEALRFVDPGADRAVPVTVEAETPLNEKTVTLALTVGGREILISRPAGTPGPNHGKAAIAIDGSQTLLFDKESGARLSDNDGAAAHQGAAA